MTSLSSLLLLLFVLTSCSSIDPLNAKKPQELKKPQRRRIVKKARPKFKAKRKVANIKKISQKEKHGIENFSLSYGQKHFKFWVNHFQKKDVARFRRYQKRGIRYERLIRSILKEHGLPGDLFYVGLIESGFSTRIRSHADAVGPWQFIKGTATRYGLKVNRSIDERYNIYKSTHAAASYFKDLYNIFGSWELALCAYNAGEYRIINAIRRGNTRDYKKLVELKLLPKETIFYIPKIDAAKYLSKRGFRAKETREARFYSQVGVRKIKGPFNLKKLARKSKISFSALKKLNPDYKSRWMNGGRRGLRIILPLDKIGNLERRKSSKRSFRKVASRKSSVKYHRVKRGDTLLRLARKYRTTTRKMRRLNRLKSSMIKVGSLLKIPVKDLYQIYVVKSGDNLTKIARLFSTSINDLLKVNSLKRKVIYPNQRIKIPRG